MSPRPPQKSDSTEDLSLMLAHFDACYVVNQDSDIVCVNDWIKSAAPALWVGFTSGGTIWRFHKDVPPNVREQTEALLLKESFEDREAEFPAKDSEYRRLFPAHGAKAGPTYWMPLSPTRSSRDSRPVSSRDQSLLEGTQLSPWIPDIPHQQPMFVSLDSGKAVSICASVRITETAHVAGVETSVGFRRRGRGSDVVAAWATEVIASGATAFYSTSWQNQASRCLARRVGFRRFGWEYSVG